MKFEALQMKRRFIAGKTGYFDHYQHHTPHINAMHQLSITYCKLVQNYVQQRTRLRALVELIFPEFADILPLRTKSAQYLVSKYFLLEDFLTLDLEAETKELEKVSGRQHGEVTLLKLQEAAQHSIGIPVQTVEVQAYRMTLDAWLNLLKIVESQMNAVLEQLIPLAEKTSYFEILLSFKGISVRLAALFIAETRELSNFRHYKQIEKLIGYNLRQTDSGQYSGAWRMSHIGNRRLSWIVYKMTEETAKYVPEVRIKFLRRQLTRRSYRKNIIASAPTLLKSIVSLVQEKRCYEYRQDKLDELKALEERYSELKAKKQSKQTVVKQAA